jgi:agmatinase
MNKAEKIKNFDPNSPGDPNANIFGLPFSPDEADIVLIPVPWEVTVSYGAGTAAGPEALFDASFQVDLFDPEYPDFWKKGIALDAIPEKLKKTSNTFRKKAEKHIDHFTSGKKTGKSEGKNLDAINNECIKMTGWVYDRTKHWVEKNKIPGLIGGDHSTPLGIIKALSEKYPWLGILQIDAHADLRIAFEGFKYSHASIMYNVLMETNIKKLVQIGIRDYCLEEVEVMRKEKKRVTTFFDRDIKHRMYKGESWGKICQNIIAELPKNIYISFDIDGLDPKLCPDTGTPVPGGFEFEEIGFLLEQIIKAGKKIVGFDLNEVAPGKSEWNANVGARMLFRLASAAWRSNRKK